MQIPPLGPRLPSSAPSAAAPAAEALPPEPRDEVLPGTARAPGGNPWPELGKLAVLGGSTPVPGALGAVLTASAREGLRAVFERLEAAGVQVERERTVRLPLLMDKSAPMSPEEAVERLGRQEARFERLQARVPGTPEPVPLRDLKDLRALDALYGAGVEAADPGQAENHALLASLREAGWEVRAEEFYYHDRGPTPALQVFRRMEEGQGVRLVRPDYVADARTPEQLRAAEFFHGSGRDLGLEDPELARRLLGAEAAGLRLVQEGRLSTPHLLYLGKGRDLGVRSAEDCHVPVQPRDLADPDALRSRVQGFEALYARTVRPALQAAGLVDRGAAAAALLFPPDPLPLEARAAVLAEVLRACAGEDPVGAATALYQDLRQGAGSAAELGRRAARALPVLREAGAAAAREVLAQGRAPEGGAPGADANFLRILEATGSVEVAAAGMDLGPEAEGLGLFLEIARRESEASLPLTAEHHRSVLASRSDREEISETAGRFLRLLEGLGVGGHQDRAGEVFATLQGDPAAGADGRLDAFLRNLALSQDVDRALEATAAAEPAGGIRQGEDYVEIGGVRIPRSPAG